MTTHPDAALSAYADGGLPADVATGLTEHLAACARCTGRVAELQAVRRLLAAAPPPRPTRSFVPRIRAVPAWLRPARSLASIGAGTFLFLFLASAVLTSGSQLGGGTTAAERAAARGQLSVPAASAAPQADAAAPTSAAAKAAPAAGQTPPSVLQRPEVVVTGDPAATPLTAARQFGPPPGVFALFALLFAAAALLAHRRLRRV